MLIIGTIISMVSGFLSTAGSAIISFASSLMTKIPTALSAFDDVIKIVQPLAESFKVLSSGESIEMLGAKACQADKNPEDFDSNAAYINYLKDEINLDEERFENRGKAEQFAHKAAGISLISQGIEEKTGIEIVPDFWVKVSQLSLESSEVAKILDAVSASKTTAEFVDYFQGNLAPVEKVEIGDQVRTVFSKLYPEMDQTEVVEKIQNMCATVRNNEWKEKE